MKLAYVTLATTPRYIEGARCLYKSYQLTNSKIPFYCMVPDNLDVSDINDLPLIKTPYIDVSHLYKAGIFHKPHFDFWNKLNVWLLQDFDYIFFLDADMVMQQNCDEIFYKFISTMGDVYLDPQTCDFELTDKTLLTKNVNMNWFITKPSIQIYQTFYEYMQSGKYYYEQIAMYQMWKDKKINLTEHKETPPIEVKFYLLHDPWALEFDKYWESEEGLQNYYNLLNKIKKRKLAVITLATTSNYLKGAALMYETYKATNDENLLPFYVMVLKDQDLTGYEYLPTIPIDQIKPSWAIEQDYQTGLVTPDVFCKWNCWLYTQYDYILYVDVDVIIAKNLIPYLNSAINLLEQEHLDLMYPEQDFNSHVYINTIKPAYTTGWLLLKPNKDFFDVSLPFMETNKDEETMLYQLVNNNKIKAICHATFKDTVYWNFNQAILHLHWNGEKEKFWNDPDKMKLYNLFLKDNEAYHLWAANNGSSSM